MKVALLNMPWKSNGLWGVRAGSRWPHLRHPSSERDYLPYPFFLGYATSLLEKNGFQALLIDGIANQIEIPDFIKLLEREKPDLIVAETSTPSLDYDISLAERLRSIAPIAICGPEYNMRNLSFLKDKPFIDYVLLGEYEYTLLELSKVLQDKKQVKDIQGIIYRLNGKCYKTPLRPLIKNLDDLPWPHRNSLFMEHYVDAPGGMPLPCAQIWSSRGCPFKCIFCLWPHIMYHGNTYRMRDPVKVVDEIEYLLKESKFKSIYIDDDTANVSKQFLVRICQEIKRRNLRFPWALMARPDLMDKELLTQLRSAGLYSIKYGVESASQKILGNANKNMNLGYALDMIRFTNSLGIKTHLTFTFGLPGETKESIEKTIRLSHQLNPYSVQFSITTPFPGTSYFDSLKSSGWKEPDDWSSFDGHKAAVVEMENLSSSDLESYLSKAYKIWNEEKKKALISKHISEEIKSFWNHSKLYGLKSAFQKKSDYLNIKRQICSENSAAELSENKNTLLKGILQGSSAYTGPKTVVIDITNKCNLNCIGCWLYSPYAEKNTEELNRHLEIDKIKDLVDDLHKNGVEEIQISGGGEPLMHPNFIEIIKYIKAKNISTHLITNFSLFNKAIIDELIKCNLDYITISLWAADAQTYLKIHPNSSQKTFENIISNIEYLVESRNKDKPLVKIYNVISTLNYKSLPQMLDFALGSGVDYLEFQIMDTIKGRTDHFAITKNEALEIEKMLADFKDRNDYVPDFISDEDLSAYELEEHKKELSDFGRFTKKIKKGFSVLNGVRAAS
ncbi:MAG: radical SAM protein, partial [Candidatus Omnitrophica bacterium]|nr:radical SAM protein [Candidatus Omnitrophota bacterium]